MATSAGLHYLPLIVFLLFPLTFITSYSLAVKMDHIRPFFAYISDTGTLSPEMCYFALGLSVAMVFIGLVAYIRYMQLEEYFRQQGSSGRARITNKVALFFGLVAAFGSCVVGCFQELSVLSIHFFGASMAFGGGSIFLILNGFLTRSMVPHCATNALAYFRILLGFICLGLYFTCIITGIMSFTHFIGDKPLKWEPHHGGWHLRVISTVTEWTMAGLFDIYFLTFVPEFRKISFVGPQFRLIEFADRTGNRQEGEKNSTIVMHPVNNNVDDYNYQNN